MPRATAGENATTRPASQSFQLVMPNPVIAWRTGESRPSCPGCVWTTGGWGLTAPGRACGLKATKKREGNRRDVVAQESLPTTECAAVPETPSQRRQPTWALCPYLGTPLPVDRRVHNCSCRRCGTAFWKARGSLLLRLAGSGGARVRARLSSEHCVFFSFGLGDVFCWLQFLACAAEARWGR